MKDVNIAQATALTSPDPLVLVCTKKADGSLNMAPVSFFMYASFTPAMLAFAMGKAANTGENIRRTGKAVLAVPGTTLKDAAMAYGTTSGSKTNKLEKSPLNLQSMEGTDIQFPEDTKIAFSVSLEQTVETGDHYLYVCKIDKMVADENREALFAWDGYALVSPAQKK